MRQERCESGCRQPVTNHDSQGIPLCRECWEQLLKDDGICFACGQRHPDALDFHPIDHPGAAQQSGPWRCIAALAARPTILAEVEGK